MKTITLAVLCIGLLNGATALAADRFAETQAKINHMLAARLKPAPLATTLPNPFNTGGPKTISPETTPGVVVQDDDFTILTRLAGTLKISGVIRSTGAPQHAVINSSAYKEGDLLQIRDSDPPEYVRIVRIEPRELTLGYKTATVKIPIMP